MKKTLIGLLVVSLVLYVVLTLTRKPINVPDMHIQASTLNPWYQTAGNPKFYQVSCFASTCEVFFTSSIGEQSNYLELARLLETAPKDSTINIHLAGTGGSTDTVIYLGNAVKMSKAEVNTIIDGPVYSAHAYLSLLGHKITIGPNVFFMFHSPAQGLKSPSGGVVFITMDQSCEMERGNVDRGRSAMDKCVLGNNYYKKAIQRYFDTFGSGYITDKNLADINNGYDVYISGEEMQQRIDKKKK